MTKEGHPEQDQLATQEQKQALAVRLEEELRAEDALTSQSGRWKVFGVDVRQVLKIVTITDGTFFFPGSIGGIEVSEADLRLDRPGGPDSVSAYEELYIFRGSAADPTVDKLARLMQIVAPEAAGEVEASESGESRPPQVHGDFTYQDAEDLQLILNSPRLPMSSEY